MQLQQLIQQALQEIRQLRENPVVNVRYICTDLGISETWFRQHIRPQIGHLMFRYTPKGEHRITLADYHQWREQYIQQCRKYAPHNNGYEPVNPFAK